MPIPKAFMLPVPVVVVLYAAFQTGFFPAKPQRFHDRQVEQQKQLSDSQLYQLAGLPKPHKQSH